MCLLIFLKVSFLNKNFLEKINALMAEKEEIILQMQNELKLLKAENKKIQAENDQLRLKSN